MPVSHDMCLSKGLIFNIVTCDGVFAFSCSVLDQCVKEFKAKEPHEHDSQNSTEEYRKIL